LLSFIRSQIADVIVYQSRFTQEWWERRYGATDKQCSVIYNGVDLEVFFPKSSDQLNKPLQLLVVEGSLMGGYELGLGSAFRWAMGVARECDNAHSHDEAMAELLIIGKVPEPARQKWDRWLKEQVHTSNLKVNWAGLIPHDRIPEVDRLAHILFSTDVNAACPNSVIEALACGTPVVAFDTGALPELVDEHSGRIASYGGDPWKLDPPDIQGLVMETGHLLENLDRFRHGARARAEALFGIENMIDAYLEVMLG
jgi:glycosyltransferase involved in cell wall biosynthesis